MIRRVFLLILITLPINTFANIEFTEIMYDLEGTDAKREWVEIVNSGSNDIELTGWIFNDGSNHILNTPPENGGQGSLLLSSGEHAILASDAATFLSEHNVGGIVIDTVMSLNNSNGTLYLADSDGVATSHADYSDADGADGNGKSLQYINGNWRESEISLFSSDIDNIVEVEEPETTIDNSEPKEEIVIERVVSGGPEVKNQIKADAGENKTGVVSAMQFFNGKAYGIRGELLQNARFVWNFGDGNFKEGEHVSHTYLYPGTYRISLTVSSGEFANTDRKVVTISEADVEIVYADRGRIEIANNTPLELDLSFWKIKYKNSYFTLPKNTFILGESVGVFPAASTQIVMHNLEEISLLYPNGLVASTYLVPVKNIPINEKAHKEESSEKIIEYVYIKEKQPEPELVADLAPHEEIETKLETQTAFVGSGAESSKESDNGIYKWLLALISVVSVASLLILSRGRASTEKPLKASDFKIIE